MATRGGRNIFTAGILASTKRSFEGYVYANGDRRPDVDAIDQTCGVLPVPWNYGACVCPSLLGLHGRRLTGGNNEADVHSGMATARHPRSPTPHHDRLHYI